ncbi:MAG: VCBS domain-containing protein [Bilophila wadsworthia]
MAHTVGHGHARQRFLPAQNGTPGTYGTLTLNADGSYAYALDNTSPTVQGLGVGETLTDTFTYTVTDNHGATASNTLTVTIHGTNDAPTVAAAAASVTEDTQITTSGTLPTPSDTDVHDTVSFLTRAVHPLNLYLAPMVLYRL